MKVKRYIPPLALSFVQEESYIHLLLIKGIANMLIQVRGYIKVRNLWFLLDLHMTFHSEAS